MIEPATLAGLVVARMCHDIVSPLGAIGNGIELLEMAMPAQGQSGELALITDSLGAMQARISTFRLAFGLARGEQRMARGDLRQLLAGASARLRVDLEAEGDLSRGEAKMILLGVMCLESALPWGGRVLVCRGGPGWRLVAEATRTRRDDGLWGWLDGAAHDLDRPQPLPAEVQFPLLAAECRARGRALTWEVDDTGAEIAF
ncbi:histidine phosphotransferase family protein [Paracoccus sp. S-4012]|uniref:histidine phosphotransferase family protein n=1 Tax=Paracoccus sp. S-4012 TaxID=2665648 RepID=UPI001E5A8A05|nr:histidine phosphotransferase family protein [Paracoccus sp. S-4012]